jgi:ABC-type multidrug transport system permease subunit
MIKKMIVIFLRDFKVNFRDFLTVYLIIAPILFAIGINLLAPSINETTVNLALIDGDNKEQEDYFRDFAEVEVFNDKEEIEERVGRRDDVIGVLNDKGDYYLLQQGNEKEMIVDYAKMIVSFYEEDMEIEDTTAKITDLGKTVPPIKKLLVNILLLIISVLGGMIIALNIIEEKTDRTIRAIHLSPVSRMTYILGKCLMGIFIPIYGTIVVTLITGFKDVNILQMIIIAVVSATISMSIGFMEGLRNDDLMSAIGNIKILFLPLAAAIVGAKLLSAKWQIVLYWIPFYWAYKGNDAVLSYVATWGQIGLYSLIVLVISFLIFVKLLPKIRKGLE